MRLLLAIAVAFTVLEFLASLEPAGAQTPVTGLSWEPCESSTLATTPEAVDAARLACATLQAPLDCAEPAFGLPGWEGLATALAEAQEGDVSAFASYLALRDDSGLYAGLAIERVDWVTVVATYDDITAYETFARIIAPPEQKR